MPLTAPQKIWIAPEAITEADLATYLTDPIAWMAGMVQGSKPFARVRSSVRRRAHRRRRLDRPPLRHRGLQPRRNAAMGRRLPDDLHDPANRVLHRRCVHAHRASTANKALRALRNSTDIVEHDNIGVSTPAFTQIAIVTLDHFDEGDTYSVQGFQDSGGTINAVVSGSRRRSCGCLVRDRRRLMGEQSGSTTTSATTPSTGRAGSTSTTPPKTLSCRTPRTSSTRHQASSSRPACGGIRSATRRCASPSRLRRRFRHHATNRERSARQSHPDHRHGHHVRA